MRSFRMAYRVVPVLAAALAVAVPAGAQVTVWTWAANNYPQVSPSLADMVQITSGNNHAHGRKADGTAWSWGDNTYGQLGNGTAGGFSDAPVQVSGITNVVDISAGEGHVLAVKSDGTVWSWGKNVYGQLGDGTKLNRTAPVQVSGLTNVVKVSAGYRFSLALKSDGTVWAWGRNDLGQLGNGTLTDSLKPVQSSGITNVTGLSAGLTHALALKNDGTVWGWGDNYAAEIDTTYLGRVVTPVQIPVISNVTQVVASWATSHALKSDGTVWAWGGDPVEGTTNSNNQTLVKKLHNIVQIASGQYNHMALDSSGRVYWWGGDPLYNPQKRPLLVDGLARVVGIVAGYGDHFAFRDQSKPWSNTVLMQNQSTKAVSLLTITGSTFTSSTPMSPAFPANLTVGAVADVDGNGYDDIIAQDPTTRQVYLYLMQANAQVLSVNPVGSVIPENYRVVASTDMSGDGKFDPVFQDMSTQRVYYNRLDMPGSLFTFDPIDKPLAPGWKVIGSVDMDHDAYKVRDLIVHNPTTRQISVLVMGGYQGRVVQSSVSLLPTLPANWTAVGVSDYDGDGWTDILVQNTSTRQVAVLKVVSLKITGSYSISPIPAAGWTVVGPK